MDWLVREYKANICTECFKDLNEEEQEEEIDWTTIQWGKDLCRRCKMKKVMESCGYNKHESEPTPY